MGRLISLRFLIRQHYACWYCGTAMHRAPESCKGLIYDARRLFAAYDQLSIALKWRARLRPSRWCTTSRFRQIIGAHFCFAMPLHHRRRSRIRRRWRHWDDLSFAFYIDLATPIQPRAACRVAPAQAIIFIAADRYKDFLAFGFNTYDFSDGQITPRRVCII